MQIVGGPSTVAERRWFGVVKSRIQDIYNNRFGFACEWNETQIEPGMLIPVNWAIKAYSVSN